MTKILVVEDEAVMRDELVRLLETSGYQVAVLPELTNGQNSDAATTDGVARQQATDDGRQGDKTERPAVSAAVELPRLVRAILDQQPQLLLLDINLPTLSGVAILKAIRAESDLPIIMVTANAADSEQVLSMSYGADDYVTKPYNPNILLLRIAAVLKRANSSPNLLEFHGLRVDLGRGVIEAPAGLQDQSEPKGPKSQYQPTPESPKRPRRLLLTKNEMIILGHLLEAKGQIVTRDALMTDLWNNQEYINDNALTVNISRLRTKLSSLGLPDAIETRKGLGYVLS